VGQFGAVKGQEPGNKGRRFPAEPLTPDEVAAIIGECSARSRTGIRNRALLVALYRSGVRISEALALRPADVDLKRHTVRVLHGKGDKATVRGFHPSADDALARWIDTRKGLGLRNGPLFCTLDGGALSDRYVRNLLHRLADRAGVEKRVHPHGLRHTFADELRAAGMDVVKISKLLGHSSIAVTNRYLDHLTNDQAVAALEAVALPELAV
jgi:site-specific recombinase XerD